MMTLEQCQEWVQDRAPCPYYAEKYRGMEDDYLPEVCRRLEGAGNLGHVLEIGPGWGTMARWLTARGVPVTLMDIMPFGHYITDIALLETGAPYVQQDICAQALPVTVDTVIMTQVIPHLKWRPDRALHNIAAMLRPGGAFYCTVLDRARYPDVETPFDTWQSVPCYQTATPTPDMVTVMYDVAELRSLLWGVFDGSAETAEGSTCIFGKGIRL